MKTKRKLLSILLAACMILTFVPTTAFAADDYAFEVISTDGTATKYVKLQDARKAMKDGYTLKLLKDYVSTPDYNFGISIDGKVRGVTIDLNGCSVTSNQNNGYALKLEQSYGGARDNTVTIKNSGSKQSVLTSSDYQIKTSSGDSHYTQIVKLEGDIAFKNSDKTKEPLGIKLGTGSKLLDTDSARNLVLNGGFSVKAADGNAYIYGNLANAAGNSSDGNITLLHDYKGNEAIYSGSKDSILDLDGHTYTYTGDDTAIDVNHPNVTLTIKNGKIVAEDEKADGATLIGGSEPSVKNNRGLVLDGVELTVYGAGKYGIVTNGTETGNKVVLKNSVLNVKKGFGVYFPSTGDVTIESSVINAEYAGVQICSGNLKIIGETVITVTGRPQAKTENDGAIADGAAVSIVNREGYKKLETVSIENGVFTSAADVEAVKAYSFNNENKIEEKWAEAGKVVEVIGGTFSSNISENIVKSDTQVTVTSGGETKVAIGKNAAGNAIKALKKGDKITFTKAANDAVVTIPEGVEITNNTGKNMIVNGTVVEDGETIIVEKDLTNPTDPTDKPGDDQTTPSNPGDTDKADDGKDSPKTGDNGNISLWIALMMATGAALAGTVFYSRKKKYNQ